MRHKMVLALFLAVGAWAFGQTQGSASQSTQPDTSGQAATTHSSASDSGQATPSTSGQTTSPSTSGQSGMSGQTTSPSTGSAGQTSPSTGAGQSGAGQSGSGQMPSGAGASADAGSGATGAAGGKITEGCLGGTNPNYTITDASGTTYKLNIPPGADASPLAKHIGESVQVQGTVNKAQSTSDAGSTKSTSNSSSIDVARIGRGTGTCPNSQSGAQAPTGSSANPK